MCSVWKWGENFELKQNRQKYAWLLLARTSVRVMRCAPSFIIMWSKPSEKMHTSPATKKKTKLHPERYSLEIDERLSTTQLCLSDCNLIISITALAFKFIHTYTPTNLSSLFFSEFFFLLLLLLWPIGKVSWVSNRKDVDTENLLTLNNRWMHFVVCRWIGNCGWSCWGSLIVSTLSTCCIYTIVSWSFCLTTKEIKTKQCRERKTERNCIHSK